MSPFGRRKGRISTGRVRVAVTGIADQRDHAARVAAIDAASGTRCMRSITVGTNDGSTRWRPMPSIRDGLSATAAGSSSSQPSQNAECSMSPTHSRVSWQRRRT